MLIGAPSRDKLTQENIKSFIIQNTSSVCDGTNSGENLRDRDVGFRGERIGPRGDDYEACTV